MGMAERLGNLGYFGLIKEATPGVALAPTDFIPLYEESLSTELNLVEDNPVAGNRFARYQILQGQRSHGGDFTVFAEANTAAKLLDMLIKKSSTTGSAPYTHVFDFSGDSNTYTVDISTGNQVFRMIGVKASELAPVYQDNQLRLKVKCSALKSFYGREVASIATTSVTFSTTYDPSPTTGLVVGDLVRLTKASDGTFTDFTISTITNATTVVLSATAAAYAAGDFFSLRPATVAFNLRAAFLFALTEYRFGATAAAALSATHTPVESDSEFSIIHNFEDDGGAKRSGSFDPAALVRTQGDATLKVKRFFDDPLDVKNFLSIAKRALVIRMFSESQVYELRLTFNNIKLKAGGKPMVSSGDIEYYELEYLPMWDTSDGAAVIATVINNLATI